MPCTGTTSWGSMSPPPPLPPIPTWRPFRGGNYVCWTRAPEPAARASTSVRLAIDVSPGVVKAQWCGAVVYGGLQISGRQETMDQAGREAVATAYPVVDLDGRVPASGT